MVLSMMRRHAKSWLIKFLVAIISLVFIFYFGYSFTSRKGAEIARVNGEVITGVEYQKAYRDLLEAVQAKYKDYWNDNLIEVFNLKERALNDLISQKLIRNEAEKLGLEVTEAEIKQAIMSYPAFQVDGRFSMRRYQNLLANNRMKPEEFEQDMAGSLLEQKIRQFLFTFITATDQEVLDFYTYANEKIKIRYVKFSPENFKEDVNPDTASLKAFFKGRRQEYRIPEKIKVGYIEINPADFKDKVRISESEIRTYFEYNKEDFTRPKMVRARHILFKVDPQAPEEEVADVRAQAEEVLQKARGGKDFSKLAEKYSDDPSKSEGGDIGYFSKGEMTKPFENAAFDLKEGEISDLVRTRFGFHIIKVIGIKEAEVKQLEMVRNEITKRLVESAAKEMAHEKGLTLLDQMPYDIDLGRYALEQGLKMETTEFFSETETIPVLGGDQRLRESLFSLEQGETSELMELDDKYYIFQVREKKQSYLPEMQEVVDKVKKDFIAQEAFKKASTAARELLADLKSGKTWSHLLEKRGLDPKETDFFTRRQNVPQIGDAPELKDILFSLNEAHHYPDDIYENEKGAFVIKWEAEKGIDKEEYQGEKQKYRRNLIQTKQERAYQNWLESLKAEADIEIITPLDRV